MKKKVNVIQIKGIRGIIAAIFNAKKFQAFVHTIAGNATNPAIKQETINIAAIIPLIPFI